jgi:single-strand selective monofunctional uracil DNA glycosylase
MSLNHVSARLRSEVSEFKFSAPVEYVYNPLDYARIPHQEYLRRFGQRPKEVLFVGMNPGPFGMAQTGVPFGDVAMVRDWMGICGPVSRPEREHPKRLIEGFACSRSEVSGTRLWEWAQDRFGTPERFFTRFFVWNYCPLCFMSETGANITPDILPASESRGLFESCNRALSDVVAELAPQFVIGVGKFAEKRIRACVDSESFTIGSMPHPSPASPAANRDWPGQADSALRKIGIEI